mgnify:CR=1 FL=1
MPFPDVPRTVYGKNPLDRVICQLRFPPILRIDKEVPAEFQDRIRSEYPGFSEREELPTLVAPRIQREFLPELLRQTVPGETRNYQFSTEDGIWTVNLTRNFLALTTNKYVRREEFKERLKTPLKVLIDEYEPACFSRIGLRYVDIIKRSALGLSSIDWGELLQPHALGLLSSSVVSSSIESLEAKYEILLEDGTGIARIVMALVQSQEDDGEECFMIDTDFYTVQKTMIEEVENKLDYFHVRASRLIRWLITNRLHDAMEPEPL